MEGLVKGKGGQSKPLTPGFSNELFMAECSGFMHSALGGGSHLDRHLGRMSQRHQKIDAPVFVSTLEGSARVKGSVE